MFCWCFYPFFLLLVGMYVYHVNSLKEGAWAVGNNTYTTRGGPGRPARLISRELIDKSLDHLTEVAPSEVDAELFYRDRLSELSRWADRLSMPEIKAKILSMDPDGMDPARPWQSPNENIRDIVSEMKNKLLLRDAAGVDVGASSTIKEFQKFFPSGSDGRGFENIANQLDQVFKQLKLERFSFDDVWNYFMDKYPLLDPWGGGGGLKETNLKAKWEQKWKEYPEPPEWGVTGTTTTTTTTTTTVGGPPKDPETGILDELAGHVL